MSEHEREKEKKVSWKNTQNNRAAERGKTTAEISKNTTSFKKKS